MSVNRLFYFSVGILGFFILWGFFRGLEVHNLMSYAYVALFLVFVKLFEGAFKNDITQKGDRLLAFFSSVLTISLISIMGTIASYAAAWGNTPVNTKIITDIDAFLGFNWVAFDKLFYPPILNTLAHIFYSTLPIATLLVLGFLSKEKANDFINFFTVALAITIIISYLAPVLPPTQIYSSPTAHTEFMPGLLAAFHKTGIFSIGVKSLDGNMIYDINHNYIMMGIVHLPSFHVVLACSYIYFARFIKSNIISVLLIIFGIGQIISCMPVGTHHLTDVIGGITVSWFSLFLLGQVNFVFSPKKINSLGLLSKVSLW